MLQIRVLVVRRYSRIAVFHALIVGQTFGTRKAAFLAGLRIVPKLTLFETALGLVGNYRCGQCTNLETQTYGQEQRCVRRMPHRLVEVPSRDIDMSLPESTFRRPSVR